jgi:hypothetical protein
MKLRAHQIQETFTTILFIVCLSVSSLKTKIEVYKTTIYLLFCMGMKLVSFTLQEEHRLRVSENGVLSRVFGPTGEEAAGVRGCIIKRLQDWPPGARTANGPTLCH